MFELIIGLILFTIVLSLIIIWMLSRADCDLTLLLREKFGRSVGSLKGKVCWITGASSGIGEHLAYILAKSGVKLVISGTNEERLAEVKRQCISFGQLEDKDVLIQSFNIKDFAEHEKQLKQVLSHFKGLDILVSNAGRSQRAPFQDIDISVDKEIFDINVFGLLSLTRVVLRYFLNNEIKGQFLVTSSAAGKLGAPYSASYTGSKHALHGYFDCLRNELIGTGITVTLACPGPVYSRLLANLYSGNTEERVNSETNRKSPHRMATNRCSYLMAIALANSLSEVWICKQPTLSLYYLSQYCPSITRSLMSVLMTKERLSKYREGNE